MSCIVYQTDQKTGAKYAYESVSYWDKDKQQPRSKRKYLGRVDPETNEIIGKKEREGHSADDKTDRSAGIISGLTEELAKKNEEIASLRQEIHALRKKNEKLIKTAGKISKLTEELLSVTDPA